MSRLFYPAIALMNRLKYLQKFALISLLFALPLTLVLVLLISESSQQIASAQQEQRGVVYLRALRGLLEQVPQARSLAQEYSSGRASARSALVSRQAAIEEQFETLAALDRELGSALRTTERFNLLRENWRFAADRTVNVTTSNVDYLYILLVAEIRSLISHVGDASGLISDPDLDSYYLMDTVVLKLPDGESFLAEAKAVGDEIAQRRTASVDEKVQLTVLAGLIRANVDATASGMGSAFRNSRVAGLKPRLEQPLDEFKTAAGAFLETDDLEIISKASTDVEPLNHEVAGTKALDASFDLWDRTVVELESLLQARMDRLNQKERLIEIVSLLTVSLAVYLFVAFYLSVTRTVSRLDEASQRMVDGDMAGPVTVENRDELGQVVRSFNTIATRLRAEWSQAREESRRATAAEAELRDRVDELRALGEVGQAVSSTLDLQQVLTTIVSHADGLSGSDGGVLYEYDEDSDAFQVRATRKYDADLVEAFRASPIRVGEGAMGQAAVVREPVQIPDILEDAAYQGRLRDLMLGAGFRAILAVPLLREDRILGGLVVARKSPGEFPPNVVDLVQTFASQSALAIQNARLYREVEDKSLQLELASKHKSDFLANMSHELRTPLNAIIGFSEVLVERMFGEVNEKQEEYLQDILSSGKHLLSLINDILDLSKVEAGQMELELGEFLLREALENGLTMLKERASRHGIQLGLEIEDGLQLVEADERKVKQVVFNLLSNAVKFTPDGGRIGVSARRQDGEVLVAVRDSGIGIAPGDQGRVFEEFRQVGEGTAKAEGTGLGLALTKRLVELHGGRIWVESAIGAGSTFTFSLPARL